MTDLFCKRALLIDDAWPVLIDSYDIKVIKTMRIGLFETAHVIGNLDPEFPFSSYVKV